MSLVKDGYAYEVWNKRDVLHHSPVSFVKRKTLKRKNVFSPGCFVSFFLDWFTRCSGRCPYVPLLLLVRGSTKLVLPSGRFFVGKHQSGVASYIARVLNFWHTSRSIQRLFLATLWPVAVHGQFVRVAHIRARLFWWAWLLYGCCIAALDLWLWYMNAGWICECCRSTPWIYPCRKCYGTGYFSRIAVFLVRLLQP